MTRRALHIGFVLSVCGYLVYRLSELGWYEVLASLPVSPWFYILFVVRFLSLPLFEIVIYRRFWRFSIPRSIPVFLRKRVYNHALLDYSGEAYFYLWAQKNSRDPETRTFSIIKDVNIASAIVSIAVMIGLLLTFASSSSIHQVDRFFPSANVYLWIFSLFSLASLCVLIALRRRVVFLSATDMAAVSTIHVVRLTVVLLLQALQWWVAIPAVPLGDWLFFLTLYMVVGRLPFVPSKDLAFLAAAVALAGTVPAQETAISAMFLANLALYQIANLLAYTGTSFKDHAMFIGKAERRQSRHA
jgi:hypothetical protein